jgi:predicted glycosyltransferase
MFRVAPRILYYAIDAAGLGHTSRVTAIAAAVASERAPIHQVVATTSPNANVVARRHIPLLKIPNDDTIAYTGVERRLRALWRSTAEAAFLDFVRTYRPGAVVFDVAYPPALLMEIARHSEIILILRDCKEGYIRGIFERDEWEVFAKILVAQNKEAFLYGLSPSMRGRVMDSKTVKFVGPIVRSIEIDERQEDAILRKYDIQTGDKLLLIAGGGGGPASEAIAFLKRSFDASGLVRSSIPVKTVAVAGAYAPMVTAPEDIRLVGYEADLFTLMARANAVVAVAGYNTTYELLSLGTPAVLVPLPRRNESQVDRCVSLSAELSIFDLDTPLNVAAELIYRAVIAPRRMPRAFYGAREAALEIIAMVATETVVWSVLKNVKGRRVNTSEDLQIAVRSETQVQFIIIDFEFLFQIDESQMVAMLADKDIIVNLGTASSATAADTLCRFMRIGLSTSRITLTISDPIGARLPEFVQTLAAFTFSHLIGRIGSLSAVQINAIYRRCRAVRTAFTVDMTAEEEPLLFPCDPPSSESILRD